MPTIENTLSSRLSAAALSAFGQDADPELRTATRPEFGHFQSNLPLRLARSLGEPPRVLGDGCSTRSRSGTSACSRSWPVRGS